MPATKTEKPKADLALKTAQEIYEKLIKRPSDVFVDAKQAVEIFKLFTHKTLLERVLAKFESRAFLQAALMSAVDASAMMGFLGAILTSTNKPSPSIAMMILKMGNNAYQYYFRQKLTNLKDLKIYTSVINSVYGAHNIQFSNIEDGQNP